MIITRDQVRRANWKTCPRCNGEAHGVTRTGAGWYCTYCDGEGKIPRHEPHRPAALESRCEPYLDRG